MARKYTLKFYILLDKKREFDDKEQIDYRDVSNIQNVIKDQLIAEVVPVDSLSEIELDQHTLEFDEIDDVKDIFVDNFYIDNKDPSKIYASISGRIFRKNGKFYITDKLEIENVDFSTGNIHFVGDLTIKGDVKPGFEVKARNVFVGGNIDNAKVLAGEKIVVKGGVIGLQGKLQCVLKAEKMIVLNFVENSHIECNGSVYIKKSSMHTNIYSNENIVVTEKPGYIVGGEIISKKNILARVVGSKWGTKTILKSGIDPFKYLRLKELLYRKEKREKLLNEVEKSLNYLNEVLSTAKNEEEKADLQNEINEIERKKNKFQKRLTRLNRLINKLEQEIDEENKSLNLKEAKIFIYEKVYPGVEIRLGLEHHKIQDTIEGKMCFFLDDNGEVKYREIQE